MTRKGRFHRRLAAATLTCSIVVLLPASRGADPSPDRELIELDRETALADGGADGSLGVTVGEAEIRDKDPSGKEVVDYTSYLTGWRRMADGTLRFFVDAGGLRRVPPPAK